jgi:hypothetical protein
MLEMPKTRHLLWPKFNAKLTQVHTHLNKSDLQLSMCQIGKKMRAKICKRRAAWWLGGLQIGNISSKA